jgi:hypothetical protein
MPFFLLDLKDSYDYLKQTWFLPLIILVLYLQFGHMIVRSHRPAFLTCKH